MSLSYDGKIQFTNFCANTEKLQKFKKVAIENQIESLEFSQFLGTTITVRDDGLIKAGFDLIQHNRKVQVETMEYDSFVKQFYNEWI